MTGMWEWERELRASGRALVAGVDEAGRGSLCGPVVAAAYILRDPDDAPEAADSKTLDKNKRRRLYARILDKALDYSVGLASAREVDELNVLRATHLAMARALRGLRFKPVLALVDGPTPPLAGYDVSGVIGGDATVGSIAAASIIAKVTRDTLMHELAKAYPGYGLDSNMGYGTRLHMTALSARGPSPIHRLTFSGVRQPKLMI